MDSVLTIAGSDSGGGAGIQQDLKVFSSFRVHGASAVTAVTAQNTLGVQETVILSKDIIESQIDSVMFDLKPAAVKTGMLANSEIIDLVCRKVEEYKIGNLVVDPVMVATSGDRLLKEDAIGSMNKLIDIAQLSTPNIREAEILSGISIGNQEDMEAAARSIGDCVVKGGHMHGTDILCYGDIIYRFPSKKKKEIRIHGTGCAFSAAVAACLARGLDVPDAVYKTKQFMDSIIARNFSIGSGSRIADTAHIRLGETYDSDEKKSVVESIEAAIRCFVSDKNAYKLIPEVGVNIVAALEDAKTLGEVAGVSGRLVRCGEEVVLAGSVKFNGSVHVSRIVLTVMKYDPVKRAAMNIRFSEEILRACEKLCFAVSSFSRDNQPSDSSTMEWGTAEAIKRLGKVPDIIYDKGGVGKEAMIRIIGRDSVSVIESALRIAEYLD